MDIDSPDVIAEVSEAFRRYETALVTNDVATLDALFYKSALTIRYGATECLYGYEAIQAFRSARPSAGLDRRLEQTVITAWGRDAAVASTLFYRDAAVGKVGRQMQTWVRMPEGWRIVAAHVSLCDEQGARDSAASDVKRSGA